MEITFKGKRALVTGASKGIGRYLSIQLAKCNAKVIAVARSKELLDDLKKEEPSIETIALDITNWNETEKCLKNIGNIDLLVNNAGLAILDPLTEITEEHYDRVFNVNVKSLINITKLVSKQLISRKISGSIVNVSSQASLVGLKDHSVYCATKGAVDAFTRTAALELGKHGIRVNCVNPTVIMTDMGKVGWSDPEIAGPMKDKIPFNRFGEVHEVVDTILYLLSDKSSMITGVCLPVDGGYTAI